MIHIIFYLKTTCSNTQPNFQKEIIEIGAIALDEDTRTRVSSFTCFIKPTLNPTLTDYCKEQTNITQESINLAPPFTHAVEMFKKWAKNTEESYKILHNKQIIKPIQYWSWNPADKQQLIYDHILNNLDSNWLDNHYSIRSNFSLLHNIPNTFSEKQAIEYTAGPSTISSRTDALDMAKNVASIFRRNMMWYLCNTQPTP